MFIVYLVLHKYSTVEQVFSLAALHIVIAVSAMVKYPLQFHVLFYEFFF